MKTRMIWLNFRPPSDLLKCLEVEGLSGEWFCLTDITLGDISPVKLQATVSIPTHSSHVLGVKPNLDLRKTILFIVEVIIYV